MFCITVSLRYCISGIIVLSHDYIIALLHYCINELLCDCSIALLYYCITVYSVIILLYYCVTLLLYVVSA